MSSKPKRSPQGSMRSFTLLNYLVLSLAIRKDDPLGVVDVATRREEALGQQGLLGSHPVAWIRIEQNAPSDLAEVLDDTLIPVVDERLRVDIDRPVPGEEQFLFPRLDRTRNSRADHKEQVSFSGSDHWSIPIDEMNLSVVANEDICGMDIRVAENVIERSRLEPPSQRFRPRDYLVYPGSVLSPEGSELRGD